MNTRFIKTPEKRKVIEQLNAQYGLEDLPYLLIESGKEKIRCYSGDLSKDEIMKLSEIASIEIIGLYMIKKEHDLRLSLDSLHLLKNQINKNVLEINDPQFQLWIRGNDLEIEKPQGTYVIKYKEDFVGCGKSNGKRIFNYVPKDRRIRK